MLKLGLKLGLSAAISGTILSDYAANGFEPPIVYDYKSALGKFGTGYFRKAGVEVAHDSLLTHARATNATVFDSDGLLKWAAHNLLASSEDQPAWGQTNILAFGSGSVENAIAALDGNVTADLLVPNTVSSNSHFSRLSSSSGIIGETYTNFIFVKAGGYDTCSLRFLGTDAPITNYDFDAVSVDQSAGTITALDDGWFFLTLTGVCTATTLWNYIYPKSQATFSGDGVSGVYAWGGGTIRSSLGGMQNNPDNTITGLEQYVPTDANAVYKRRNNYVFNGTSWVGPVAQVESLSATNDIVNSDNFSGTNWDIFAASSLALTADQGTGPDGNASMTKVAIDTTSSVEHILFSDSHTVVANEDYCVSAVVDDVSQQFVMFRLFFGQHRLTAVTYDMIAGTVTQENDGTNAGFVVDSGVIDLGGGRLRIWTTININNTNLQVAVMTSNTGTPGINSFGGFPYSGTVGDHFFLGNVQFEKGSVPSSIIPTVDATAVRAAETLIIPSANLASIVNTTAMSIWEKGDMNYVDNNVSTEMLMLKWQLSSTNYIRLALRTNTGTGQTDFAQREVVSGLDTVTGSSTKYSPGSNVVFNIASRNVATALNGAEDGTALIENSTPTLLPDLSATDFELIQIGHGNIEAGSLWGVDIGDIGIGEATA